MASITLKQGDTTPEFTATLDDPAQELTGDETIRFYMEAPTQGEQQHGDLIVNAEIPNSQVDYQTNEVTYDFSVGETSRLDDNLAEVVVTYPDGEVQTFPDTGYHTITVEKPVNRDAPPADLSDPDITVGVVNASQVNAPTLQTVETITGSITGGKALSNIAGANLDIDANGNLNAVSGEDSPSHYNPIYDSDEDGIVDADVNNDVTNTGELSVSGGAAITAVAGTDGEFIHRGTISFPNDYSTTSTTYDTKFSDAVPLDVGHFPVTNANDIHVSVAADIGNDTDGETTTFSIRSIGTDYVEIQSTGSSTDPVASSRVPYNETGVVRVNPQLKVTGGTGTVADMSLDFWVEIGT